MSTDLLLIEKEAGIALLTFNQPKTLNALTVQTFSQLHELLIELAEDPEVRVLILTGAGEKAFVAGGDIGHLATLDAEGAKQFALLAQGVLNEIETFPKPVIAAINGYALGGGCELAMACDLRIAAETARFGQPEVNLGIIPGFAGTQRMARLIGKGKAKELIFTGDMISAEEAYRIGLVNRIVPAAELIDEARRLALKMMNKSGTAISIAKEAIDNGLEMEFLRASRYEADLFALCFTTEDCHEGISAFLEKRQPKFC
ncbi:MAG: enoyl-CoA hydratase/isomerase family protein [Deltaproteobacteria bacterium]|nr:enoyl-CoA hydratase/isomerase family protein [Deltaproteobacteria bacterium]